MDFVKSNVFRAAYFLYTRTSLGFYYHVTNLNSAERRFSSSQSGSHSCQKNFNYGNLTVTVIPFCLDNYSYVVVDRACKTAVIIDPGHAAPILEFFRVNSNIKPIAVLCTHKHWDHCAGNGELVATFPSLKIIASEDDGAYCSNETFRDSQQIHLENFTAARIVGYEMPGHTVGHALYCITPRHSDFVDSFNVICRSGSASSSYSNSSEVDIIRDQPHSPDTNSPQTVHNGSGESSTDVEPNLPPLLFTGDCLFINGIGNMFECPSVVMAATLQRIVDLFPQHTLIWPGHEYAMTFIKFTLKEVDPDNESLKKRHREAMAARAHKEPVLPGELEVEMKCNPYLRTAQFSLEKPEFLTKSSSDILQILAEKKSKFSKLIATSNSRKF